MRYLELDGLRISRIGLGTWQFGSREWGYGEQYATETAPALLRRAAQVGITMVDTAEAYGPGRSERIIGDTLRQLTPSERAGLFVATKFTPIAPAEHIVDWQARGSRLRLGVDTLDLLYVHWPNPFVSVRRVMQSLRPVLASGVARRIGVSNYSLDQWQAAERALRAPVIANEVRFSLVSPGPAGDLVPWAAGHDRMVVAYSPLGQGLVAGPASSGRARGVRAMSPLFRDTAHRRAAPLLDAVREIGAAHDATPAQVGLAWVIAHPNTVAIPGARTIAQLEENAAAADLELAEDELARLSVAAQGFAAGR